MLRGRSVEHIGAGLGANHALTSLNLADNTLGCEGAALLAEALLTNTALLNLDLKGNQVGIPGPVALRTV
jgi:Ran GTPase-activating protein (RanGAP) involved in mRNA processing and transport